MLLRKVAYMPRQITESNHHGMPISLTLTTSTSQNNLEPLFKILKLLKITLLTSLNINQVKKIEIIHIGGSKRKLLKFLWGSLLLGMKDSVYLDSKDAEFSFLVGKDNSRVRVSLGEETEDIGI